MRTRHQVLAPAVTVVVATSAPLLSYAQVLYNIPVAAPAAQLAINSANGGTLSTGSAGIVRILLPGFGSSGADIRFVPGVRILSLDGRSLPTFSVIGRTFKVRYQFDLYQQLLITWIVSDDDYKAVAAVQSQA